MKTILTLLALFIASALIATVGATALLSAFTIALVTLTAFTDYSRPRLRRSYLSSVGARASTVSRPSSLPLAA